MNQHAECVGALVHRTAGTPRGEQRKAVTNGGRARRAAVGVRPSEQYKAGRVRRGEQCKAGWRGFSRPGREPRQGWASAHSAGRASPAHPTKAEPPSPRREAPPGQGLASSTPVTAGSSLAAHRPSGLARRVKGAYGPAHISAAAVRWGQPRGRTPASPPPRHLCPARRDTTRLQDRGSAGTLLAGDVDSDRCVRHPARTRGTKPYGKVGAVSDFNERVNRLLGIAA